MPIKCENRPAYFNWVRIGNETVDEQNPAVNYYLIKYVPTDELNLGLINNFCASTFFMLSYLPSMILYL